ncbi:hypothetical protein JCGZ_00205 [Jatropha curcas]|uniref:TF-B3 domain-containing protein n=1 Tax=Jatropha curcas TaxID=180498 RepID=A0A067L598_JATCU|nr:hypothetical protein JCGZ_00205 [Jatropha curcas]
MANTKLLPEIKSDSIYKLCEKPLRKTDLEHQFIAPSDFLKKLADLDENGESKEKITSFDRDGKEWTFRLSIRKTEKYSKPTLTPASWRPFVKHFGLRDGDAVIFYIIRHDGARKIQIRGLRKIIFLGKPTWKEVKKVENQALTSHSRV